MDDIKKAYAWREALELSKRLVQICEEFSDVDTNVLVWHLRNSVVDIPSTIAADLQASRWATMEPVVKLATVLELVRKIYPAIETSPAEDQLEKLMQRMQSEQFTEREPEPEESEESSEKDSAEKVSAPAGKADTSSEGSNESAGQPSGVTVQLPNKVDGVQHAAGSADSAHSSSPSPQEA
ncbi:MAG TPA: hypothetical protein VMR75_02540 [Candidatus Saccharimonadales bacterium]|nr:hypothetical protein [Candidatus Saccharimonadales bacterium]